MLETFTGSEGGRVFWSLVCKLSSSQCTVRLPHLSLHGRERESEKSESRVQGQSKQLDLPSNPLVKSEKWMLTGAGWGRGGEGGARILSTYTEYTSHCATLRERERERKREREKQEQCTHHTGNNFIIVCRHTNGQQEQVLLAVFKRKRIKSLSRLRWKHWPSLAYSIDPLLLTDDFSSPLLSPRSSFSFLPSPFSPSLLTLYSQLDSFSSILQSNHFIRPILLENSIGRGAFPAHKNIHTHRERERKRRNSVHEKTLFPMRLHCI